MPSNKQARFDVRLKVSQREVEDELGKFTKRKQEAVRKVFKEVGDLYKQILAEKVPSLGLSTLNKSFKYRTTTTKQGIQLIAGVLNAQEFGKVHDFLRFWLYGTKKHWVSLKAHPELGQWAVEHGILSKEGDFYYDPDEDRHTVKTGELYKTRALNVGMRSHIYDVEVIQKQVIKQLLYKLKQI